MEKIIIYTTKTWPHCATGMEFLREKNYDFIEKNLDEDREASMDFMKRKLPGLPVFFIGDDIVLGFDKDKIERLMDYKLFDCPSCGVRIRIPNNSEVCPKCDYKIN